MKYVILLMIFVFDGCGSGNRTETHVQCYNPMVAPIPFELQEGDWISPTGVVHVKRGGVDFKVYGSICVSATTPVTKQ